MRQAVWRSDCGPGVSDLCDHRGGPWLCHRGKRVMLVMLDRIWAELGWLAVK